MPLDITLLKCLAPELSDKSTTDLNKFAGLAELYVNSEVWGTKTDHAVALLTAHFCTLAGDPNRTGPIKTQTVGDLDREFGVSGNFASALELTSYGLQFLACRKTLQISPFLVC